ncbi:MAG: hypothetical protein ACRD1H_08760, partial [Vicinamibacterales bacterium]
PTAPRQEPAICNAIGRCRVVTGRISRVLEVHSALYTTLLILSLGLTAWALFFIATGRPVDGAFRSTYILSIGVAVAQALVGLILFLDDYRPASSFHYLYGISLVVFTGAGYVFSSRGSSRREPLILGIASAAAVGLIWRAWTTAHG